MNLKFKAIVALLALATAIPAFSQGDENIIRKKGNPRATVIKCDDIVSVEGNGNVKYKDGNATYTLAAKDVDYVFKARRHCQELVDGDKLLAAGKFQEALNKFKVANAKYGKMGWDVNTITLQGMCLYNMNKKTDALNSLDALKGIQLTKIDQWKENDLTTGLCILIKSAADTNNGIKVAEIAPLLLNRNGTAQATALNAQGDILYAKGKSSYEEANFKYIVAGLGYNDPNESAKGLCMAANICKDLGDSRYVKFADELKARFPGSEWVSKLK